MVKKVQQLSVCKLCIGLMDSASPFDIRADIDIVHDADKFDN